MAKISIEIDGKDVSMKIDGKPVPNVSYLSLYAYLWEYNDVPQSDVGFSYSVRNEQKEGEEFRSTTEFNYCPSTASFSEGKARVDLKTIKKEDYARM